MGSVHSRYSTGSARRMLLDIALLVAGGALLYFGAEWLVKASAGLARAFNVAPIVIGLTVVAYGTSAPEVVVTGIAAFEGRSGIALGNVIGSNIANLGLILGLTAVIRPPRLDGTLLRREVPIMLAATIVLPAMLWNDVVSRPEGTILIAGAVAFTFFTLRMTRDVPPDSELMAGIREELEREAVKGSKKKLMALIVGGLGALLTGGKIFVDGASGLALHLGMSERIIGLTIVAIGTSLPELAASVVAALRGHSEIAVGNIVGSNIFNIVLVLGGSALVRPIVGVFAQDRLDLGVLLAFTLVGAFMLRGNTVTRNEGAGLLVLYVAFLGLLAIA